MRRPPNAQQYPYSANATTNRADTRAPQQPPVLISENHPHKEVQKLLILLFISAPSLTARRHSTAPLIDFKAANARSRA
jgi:hypothetical protein